MARMMALCSLPRTNPGNRLRYVRRNGPYKLGMTAGIDNKLPFGNYPRLLLAWLSTEAVRTQSRVLVPGASLADFMRELGIYSSGGREGTKLRPRWSLQNRPMVVTAKAANGDGPGQCCFTPLNRYRASPFWYASSGDRTAAGADRHRTAPGAPGARSRRRAPRHRVLHRPYPEPAHPQSLRLGCSRLRRLVGGPPHSPFPFIRFSAIISEKAN